MNNSKPKYIELEERTFEFGKRINRLVKLLPKNKVNDRLGDQVVRSGNSIGANYREANETETKNDFMFKIGICRREAKETIYWLRLIDDANPALKNELQPLLIESMELLRIFASMSKRRKIF